VRHWPGIRTQAEYTVGEIERFLGKVEIGDPDECWEWQSAVSGYRAYRRRSQPGVVTRRPGYGTLTLEAGDRAYAHRMSYELATGEPLGELLACHHCDNSLCVNPGHLFAGTYSQNKYDAEGKGLLYHPSGDRHPHAKLSSEQVRWVRRLYSKSDTPLADIADAVGVAPATIGAIGRGKIWRDAGGAIGKRGAVRGERHHNSKLTEHDVVEMRKRRKNGASLLELAERYGVDASNVSFICNRKRWAHVE